MPYSRTLPEWNAVGSEPPQQKRSIGYLPDEYPPADWWNWQMNLTYLALKELQDNSIHKDQKGVNSGVATLGTDGKLLESQRPQVTPVADGTTTAKGIVQLEDSVTSTSATKAATPKSVKTAYDLANGKQSALQPENRRKITFGTSDPVGGVDGDIYFQYE